MKAPEPIAPEALDFAPPQDIRVVRFPKDQLEPQFVSKQTVDVTADEHHEDANLGHIPDFRQDWGYGDEWCQHRRAYRVYVAPQDIPEPKLHGWYVVFATRDPSYQKSTHRVIAGEGRHIHEDFFIAKIGTYHKNGWTVYVDMPDEFKSAKTKEGRVVYQIILAEGKTSMLGPLLGS